MDTKPTGPILPEGHLQNHATRTSVGTDIMTLTAEWPQGALKGWLSEDSDPQVHAQNPGTEMVAWEGPSGII